MLQVFIFNGNDVLPDLVQQHQLFCVVQQLLDGVGVGVGESESLDLGPDGNWGGQAAWVVAPG